MDKLWLIIKREYITRVRKRSFIIATVLTPLLIGVFMVVVNLIFSYEGGDELRIAIKDEAGILSYQKIKDEKNVYFTETKQDLPTLRQDAKDGKYDGIVVIPAIKNLEQKSYTIYYYREDAIGLDKRMMIENSVKKGIRKYKIRQLNMDEDQLDALDFKIAFQPEPLEEGGAKESSMATYVKASIGVGMSIIMYMAVLVYGMMVMRSVSEEKTSRIVEVMISSVKPFQLMLGKIIGVGAVGLTQVTIWALFFPIITFIASFFMDPAAAAAQPDMMMTGMPDAQDFTFQFNEAVSVLSEQNWWLITPLFFFFFLGGYFLYASLFAAVGSAIGEDTGESQSLTIPITLPIVIAFYIMFVAIRAPQSSLAVWASIFPFFSPIVMPARLAFDPPLWQVAASVVALLATVIFFVWLSGRIYRVGILMYGKKVGFKDLGKWMLRG